MKFTATMQKMLQNPFNIHLFFPFTRNYHVENKIEITTLLVLLLLLLVVIVDDDDDDRNIRNGDDDNDDDAGKS